MAYINKPDYANTDAIVANAIYPDQSMYSVKQMPYEYPYKCTVQDVAVQHYNLFEQIQNATIKEIQDTQDKIIIEELNKMASTPNDNLEIQNEIKRKAALCVDTINVFNPKSFNLNSDILPLVYGKYYRDLKSGGQISEIEVSYPTAAQISDVFNYIIERLDCSYKNRVFQDGRLSYDVFDKSGDTKLFKLTINKNSVSDWLNDRLPFVNMIHYSRTYEDICYYRNTEKATLEQLNTLSFTSPAGCPEEVIKELRDKGWEWLNDPNRKQTDPDYTFKEVKLETTTNQETIKENQTMTIMEFAKDRGEKIAYRTAGRTITSGTKAIIMNVFKSKGWDEGSLGLVSAFLDTELGDAIVSASMGTMLGIANNSIPQLKSDKRIAKLAEELQVEGGAIVADTVLKEVFTLFLPLIQQALIALPNETTTNVRLETESESVEEAQNTQAKVKNL